MAALAVHDADIHGGQGEDAVDRILHSVIHEVQRRARQEHRGVNFQIGLQQLLVAVPDGADPRRHQPAGVATHTGAEVFLVCVDDPALLRPFTEGPDGGEGRLISLRQQIDDQQSHGVSSLLSYRMGV